MSSNKRISASIQPINYADIHACAKITCDAFAVDPHTIVKNLGGEPYDMYEILRSMLISGMDRKKQIQVKAVDVATGEIVGHAGWMFSSIDESAIPWKGANDDISAAPEQQKVDSIKDERKGESMDADADDGDATRAQASIDRLHDLESRDMAYWQSSIIPKDEPYMIITGLHVSIPHQSRGVGSALLQYGNVIADNLDVDIWVHSSHQAYRAYKKFMFEAVRVLDIDLDEYAPRPPREDEEVMGEKGSGKWGRYIIRYMRRLPTK